MTISLRRTRIDGFGPLRDVDLDLSEPGIYAVAGPNGSGKSTLLEHAVLGAMYRETSRGGLAKSAEVKGASLETEIVSGGDVLVRHVVDATRKTVRQESVLVVDGVTTDGKVSTFDGLAMDVFPARDYLLASSFAAQGGVGNFGQLTRDERRAVLSRLLGLDRYQRAHEVARVKRRELEVRIGVLANRLEGVHAEDPDGLAAELVVARTRLGDAVQVEAECQERLDVVRSSLAVARADLDAVEDRRRDWERRRAEHDRLGREVQEASVAVDRARQAAHDLASHAMVMSEVERLEREIDAHGKMIDSTRHADEQVLERAKSVRRERDGVVDEISRLEATLARADEIRAGQGAVMVLEGDLATAEEEARAAEVAVVEARERAAEHADAVRDLESWCEDLSRAEATAERVGEVPCGGAGGFAACPLILDAVAARDAIPGFRERIVAAGWRLDLDSTSLLRGAEARLRAVKDREGCLRSDLDRARAAASDYPLLAEAELRAADLRTRAERLSAEIDGLRDSHETNTTMLADATACMDGCRRELAELAPGGPQGLRSTITRCEVARDELPALEARSRDLIARYESMDVGQEPRAVEAKATVGAIGADAEAATRELERARSCQGQARAVVSDMEVRLARAREDADRAAETRLELDGMRQELADWLVVERCYGKDGLQALLVDAAGPAISDLANQLLDVTMSHFRVSITTTRMDSTGKKLLEDLDVTVYDSTHGAARSISDLSGGEGVIVTLAIRMALVLHAGAGRAVDFIVLDEMDGALDGDNAGMFVPMLRRVMDLGGLRHVFFVSHRGACISAADHVITVQAGRVEVTR